MVCPQLNASLNEAERIENHHMRLNIIILNEYKVIQKVGVYGVDFNVLYLQADLKGVFMMRVEAY